MKRVLQILGLFLIGLLSMEARAVRAQEDDPCMPHNSGCITCRGDDCLAWFCPIGHPRGSGIVCF